MRGKVSDQRRRHSGARRGSGKEWMERKEEGRRGNQTGGCWRERERERAVWVQLKLSQQGYPRSAHVFFKYFARMFARKADRSRACCDNSSSLAPREAESLDRSAAEVPFGEGFSSSAAKRLPPFNTSSSGPSSLFAPLTAWKKPMALLFRLR